MLFKNVRVKRPTFFQVAFGIMFLTGESKMFINRIRAQSGEVDSTPQRCHCSTLFTKPCFV